MENGMAIRGDVAIRTADLPAPASWTAMTKTKLPSPVPIRLAPMMMRHDLASTPRSSPHRPRTKVSPSSSTMASGCRTALATAECTPAVAGLIDTAPTQCVPFLSYSIARGIDHVSIGNVAWRLNVVSAVFGALACGALAAMAANVAKRSMSPLEAVVGGLAAAVVFAATPLVSYAATSAGPSTLTAFLGLAAVALVVGCGPRIEQTACTYAAALMAGLAASNHAAFGLLGGLLGLAFLLFGSMTQRTVRTAAFTLVLFGAAAAMPPPHALATG